MNFDHDRRDSSRHDPDRQTVHPDDREHEISLGTATILGIFLVLALICAGFFGFGYSLGRHSAAATPAVAGAVPEAKSESPFSHFKASAAPSTKSSEPDGDSAAADSAAADPPPAIKSAGAHATAVPVPLPPSAGATDPPVASTGQFVVQVSAPSRQGDADALIAALSRKGYRAFIHKEPQDSFFHVQVGPYASKPDALAMVKRLDSDGYKPFIK